MANPPPWTYVSKDPIKAAPTVLLDDPEQFQVIYVHPDGRVFAVDVNRKRRSVNSSGPMAEADAFVREMLDAGPYAEPPGVPPYSYEMVGPVPWNEPTAPKPADGEPPPPPEDDDPWYDFDDELEKVGPTKTGLIGTVIGFGLGLAVAKLK